MTIETTKAVELFYSYAHEDEELCNALEKHLSNLKRQGLIAGWRDHKIMAGAEAAIVSEQIEKLLQDYEPISSKQIYASVDSLLAALLRIVG